MLIDEIRKRSPHSFLVEALAEAMVFRVDDVASYVMGSYRDGSLHDVGKELPNIAPLADSMWFEFDGASVGNPDMVVGVLVTVLCDTADKDDPIGTDPAYVDPNILRWILVVEYFHLLRERRGIAAADHVYLIGVGHEGQFRSIMAEESKRFGGTPDPKNKDVMRQEVLVALSSICFAHCKGVTTIDHWQPRQQRRAAEREGQPPLVSYKTIDIRPVTRILSEEGHIERNGLRKALHIVRGHFAHYTEEKKLFGRLTGTYFRPMHVRGSLDAGAVIKDYRVHTE